MQRLESAQLLDKWGMDYFEGASTLGALSEPAIRFLLQNGQIFQLERDEYLYQYGDAGDSFFVILQGRIAHHKLHEGISAFTREYVFGEEIGAVSMIGLQNRVGFAITLETSTVLRISSDLFFSLQQYLPTDFSILLLNITREMSRRLVDLSNQLVEKERSTQGIGE